MKKFFLTTSMVASFILIVSLGFAQEKQAVATAKKTVAKVVTPVAEKITPAPAMASQVVAATMQANTVADVITASKNHSTLLAALKSAGLVETLAGAGPFTVFAPTNDAFAKIPAAGLEVLLKPEYKAALTKILTGHVVSGTLKSQDVLEAIKTGGGKAILTTLSGDKITATEEKGKIKITDAAGNIAHISMADTNADNGIIHSIDAVFGTQ
jgi:uncharacterized surface protein with fasciclin (FAS1) repeats